MQPAAAAAAAPRASVRAAPGRAAAAAATERAAAVRRRGCRRHAPPTAAAAPPMAAVDRGAPSAPPPSHAERCAGALLGAMVGDALGAPFEGSPADAVAAAQRGLIGLREPARYTDDTQMSLALAASLVNRRRACAADAAAQYVRAFDPQRGYGASAAELLRRLAAGADPATTGTALHDGGSFGNGGAMRVAPVGLAFRHARTDVLIGAVRAALLCTHVHPAAVEGAAAQALAVAELSRTAAPPPGCDGGAAREPQLRLLRALRARLAGESGPARHLPGEMAAKLLVLERALQQAPALKPAAQPWADWLGSPAWAAERRVAEAVAPGFQIRATDAVAAALWAVVCHASMAGALVGALHGTAWLPRAWLDALENGAAPGGGGGGMFDDCAVAAALAGDLRGDPVVGGTRNAGRDAAELLARLLATLDCREL
ncbi:adprs [Scenedesmus sp. PABB004]|nr:adprs [Scenedesmus sp. PABB004]